MSALLAETVSQLTDRNQIRNPGLNLYLKWAIFFRQKKTFLSTALSFKSKVDQYKFL